MRRTTLALAAAAAALTAATGAAAATAQSAHCNATAREQGLTGARRTAFVRSCLKGPLAASTPTAPTAATKESQAVTKPSGVDRDTRAAQCAAEADRKHLAAQGRKQFQLSCIATAGPVSEGETATVQPHPAKQIKGIGVNNYKRDPAPAKSSPDTAPPAAAKPQG
jgi:hypothetical protein